MVASFCVGSLSIYAHMRGKTMQILQMIPGHDSLASSEELNQSVRKSDKCEQILRCDFFVCPLAVGNFTETTCVWIYFNTVRVRTPECVHSFHPAELNLCWMNGGGWFSGAQMMLPDGSAKEVHHSKWKRAAGQRSPVAFIRAITFSSARRWVFATF